MLAGLLAYLVSFAVMVTIFAVLSLGLNVQWGYGGLFNIGIAGFFLIGAYTSALVTSAPPSGDFAQYVELAIAMDQPFVVGLLAAAVVCGLVAALIGLPTLRLGGDYLAIATIGIAESIRIFFMNELWLANGHRGLVGIPAPLDGIVAPHNYNYVYLVICVVIFGAVFAVQQRMVNSPWGRVLRAVRDDELSAASSGKDVFRYRLQALIVGSMMMGVAGAMLAHFNRVLSPEIFTPLYGTFVVWVMVMAGGSGNARGVVLGAAVVWAIWTGSQLVTDAVLPSTLKSRAPFVRFLLIGILLEVVLILRPRGMIPETPRVSRFLRAAEQRLGIGGPPMAE